MELIVTVSAIAKTCITYSNQVYVFLDVKQSTDGTLYRCTLNSSYISPVSGVMYVDKTEPQLTQYSVKACHTVVGITFSVCQDF